MTKQELVTLELKLQQEDVRSDKKQLAQLVGERSYLVSYLTTEKETGKRTNKRSLWVKEENAWQLLFHEGDKSWQQPIL